MELNSDIRARLLSQADQCVKCGLCLPHCPTYVKTLDENESPRGRIALLQGLASQSLPASAKLAAHLEHCLGCRACEAVCPSRVAYGHISDEGRTLLAAQRPPPAGRRLGLALLTRRRWLHAAARVLRVYERSGLRRLARGTGLLRLLGLGRRPGRRLSDWDAQLPSLPPVHRWQEHYPAQGRVRGTVALFTGCIASIVDEPTLRAAVRTLTAIGYNVVVPNTQTCCGALHQHSGDIETALDMARKNIHAFADENFEAVISCASGCGAQLSEYGSLDWDESDVALREAAATLGRRTTDISAFLADQEWPTAPRALNAHVAVHDPCSLRNVLRAQDSVYRLLGRIPELTVSALPGNARCCGSAGTYMLTEPEMADSLRREKLDAITASAPDVVVTSNIGCAMHLANGLRSRAGNKPEILHPITLLERQLSHFFRNG